MRNRLSIPLAIFSLALAACGGATKPISGTGGATSATTGGAGSTSGTSGSAGSTGSAASTGAGSTGGSTTTSTGSGSSSGGSSGNPVIAARPYYSVAPSGYDPATRLPLVVMLHGYTSNHVQEGAYLGIEALVDSRHFFYAAPDGMVDSFGNRFWNATDACCNFDGSTVDDVGYLTAVVDDMQAHYPIDPKRIFFVGHSNGAFMSHRMACERADRIAAIAALAGDMWQDTSKCSPSEPVSVVQIHGTADSVIAYNGGQINGNAYPPAPDSVATWATKDGCGTADSIDTGAYDLDSSIFGSETDRLRYTSCPAGKDVELWTINGGSHIPPFTTEFPSDVLDFLFAHPKP